MVDDTRPRVTLVLDVGKTHTKLYGYDDRGRIVDKRSMSSPVEQTGDYPAIDVTAIWQWFVEAVRTLAATLSIRAITVSTHGACAVFVDETGKPVLPALDYEYEGLCADREERDEYEKLRPPFYETLSPSLPAGLNLGRQLFWLNKRYPELVTRARHILLYPQYFVHLLTGIAVSEATSLGCHTDLWNIPKHCPSSLLGRLGFEKLLPAVVDVTEPVGTVLPSLADATGLPHDCLVFPGVHDSNASLARHIASGVGKDIAVVSTGTWTITFSLGSSPDCLRESRDMLANVSVLSEPVCCARFMGGREYEEICRRSGSAMDPVPEEADVQSLVREGARALPNFSQGCGPFPDREAVLECPSGSGTAMASLYLALMIDYELDLLKAKGPVLLGSASTRNPLLCRLLAQLRPQQQVLLSGDDASTPLGAWCLTRWQEELPSSLRKLIAAVPTTVDDLDAYRQRWRAAL